MIHISTFRLCGRQPSILFRKIVQAPVLVPHAETLSINPLAHGSQHVPQYSNLDILEIPSI